MATNDAARSGGGRPYAPVQRWMVEVPWLEPAEAYELLRDHAPVLLDGSGAHPEARRAYLGLSPAWKVQCHHGRWTMHIDGRTRALHGGPVEVLRRLCDGMRQDVEEDGFTGGLVGYFGYGFTHHLERTLPASPAATPEAVLWLCRDALVLDRHQRRAWLWTADLPGESGARERGARLCAILAAQAVPAPVGPGGATSRSPVPAPSVSLPSVATTGMQVNAASSATTATSATTAAGTAPTPATAAMPVTTPPATPVSVPAAAPGTTAAATPVTEPAAAPLTTAAAMPAAAAMPVTTPAAAAGMTPAARPVTSSAAAPEAPARAGQVGFAQPRTTHDARPENEASMDETAFCDAVEALRRRIFEGDLFQANIATRFSVPCQSTPPELLRRLARDNPSPYMALVQAEDHAIVSCSPELLLKVERGLITTRPIAGTRRRGADADDDRAMEAELLQDAKEQAEHTMLVDLLRNDVAKVAVPGSVHVPEKMSVERYRHVMHLVSRVEGRIRPGLGFVDWLGALFPGGTITGAPKHRACLRIHEAEPVPRGPYTGSAGYLSWSHNAQWNILIRTIVLHEGTAHVHAGSGIVADSVPRREWKEAGRKAQALLEAATGRAVGGRGGTTDRGGVDTDGQGPGGADKAGGPAQGDGTDGGPGRLGEVTRHGDWQPPRPRQVPGRRVLLVDNFDSFTHNLADHVAAMGAAIHIVRNDGDWQKAMRAFAPTHVILSPGPGHPDASGATLALLRAQKDTDAPQRLPILGVCLGHQAMALVTDGQIVQVPPVHGRADDVHHEGHGLLAGLPSPFLATRYHSLAATDMPDWSKSAWSADGTLMAMQHTQMPWWGLQFHPESLCTDVGVEILARFLEVEHGWHRFR